MASFLLIAEIVTMQMSAIVGGQAVRKQIPPEQRKGDSIDPKQATHGESNNVASAMDIGKSIMDGDPSRTGSLGASGMAGTALALGSLLFFHLCVWWLACQALRQ